MRLSFLIVCYRNKTCFDPYFNAKAKSFMGNCFLLLLIEFYCYAEMKSKLLFMIRFERTFFLSLNTNSILWFKWMSAAVVSIECDEKQNQNRFILYRIYTKDSWVVWIMCVLCGRYFVSLVKSPSNVSAFKYIRNEHKLNFYSIPTAIHLNST